MTEEKKKSFFEDTNKIFLAVVILFSLGVHWYFFSSVSSQPLWWDEAEYLSMAKHWAFDIPYDLNPQRPPLFPFLASILLSFGASEFVIKFLLTLLPSILIPVLTYFLIKEIYGMKTAFFAAIITIVSWIHLFYAMRAMTDAIGLLFGLCALYCFWVGYVQKKSRILVWLIGLFVGLSVLIRLTGVIYGGFMLVFLLLTDRFKFIKSKDLWISLAIGLLTLTPLFVYSFVTFDNALAFRSGYGGVPNQPLGWNLILEVYNYTLPIFFGLFVVGLICALLNLTKVREIVFKNERKYDGDLAMVLLILFVLGFFIYLLRAAEARWMIAMSIGIFAIAGKGLTIIYEITKKYHKFFAILLVLGLLYGGITYQIQHASEIINVKKDSYIQVKDASLWIKENSQKGDVVLSVSLPQTFHYSERETYTFSRLNISNFQELVREKKPKYMLISIYEPHHPEWILQQRQATDGSLEIALPYFNSLIQISSQGKLLKGEVQQTVIKKEATYVLIYPNTLNGVFVYRLEYPDAK